MLYFAYGSNMDWQQMRERCRSATYVCLATLKNHRIAFTRTAKGKWNGYGVADVIEAKGFQVWGVVFRIDEIDIGNLDMREGYQPGRKANSYTRTEYHVLEEDHKDKPLAVWTYIVTKKETPHPRPHPDYKKLIVDGAKHWHLPSKYIRELEAIETQ